MLKKDRHHFKALKRIGTHKKACLCANPSLLNTISNVFRSKGCFRCTFLQCCSELQKKAARPPGRVWMFFLLLSAACVCIVPMCTNRPWWLEQTARGCKFFPTKIVAYLLSLGTLKEFVIGKKDRNPLTKILKQEERLAVPPWRTCWTASVPQPTPSKTLPERVPEKQALAGLIGTPKKALKRIGSLKRPFKEG